MEFGWTEEQRELYQSVLEFGRSRLCSTTAVRDGSGIFGRAEWELCGEHGVLGLPVPEELGGLGRDCLTTALAMEALGRGCDDAGLVFAASAHLFACAMPLLEHGGDELVRRVLPELASGRWIGANAITEAGAGSDAFALAATAVRDGDHYRLSGEKTYVTNGPLADVFLVYASTDPSAKFLGVSAFLVERQRPGVTVGRPFEALGLRTAPMSSLYLDDCRVPAANRVGGEGRGQAVFHSSMAWERSCLFAAWLGSMERQLDQCVEHARQRRQFGKPIGRFQAISHRIADMKLRLEAARLLLYRACWCKDRGLSCDVEISLAKVAISEAAVQSGLDAVQIHGGMGVMAEAGVERGLRDAVLGRIYSGTSELQRDLIARSLGL